MQKYCRNLGIFLLCVLILTGCGKLERKGTSPTNTPPEVYFSDIPPDGYKFSINPRIYWFGTDVDGFIAAYQYAVMRKDSVERYGGGNLDSGLVKLKNDLHVILPDSASWVNQTTSKYMFGAHVVSEPGGNQRNIRMFAEIDPEIYTPQYIFLRAVDNGGAVSEVISRMYSRNNHRPQALIDMDSATQAAFVAKWHYCLEETTATWKGISIPWKGLDTADYDIRNQPAFQFKWELVGPFASAPGRNDTLPVIDSSWDTSAISGERRWVSETAHVFKNLKNYGEVEGADAGFGWYKLRVRVRDDCFVSTDTATALNFRIVKPRFLYTDSDKKTILVVDATAYSRLQEGSPQDTGEVRFFYREALKSLPAELCDSSAVWWDPNPSHGPDYGNKNSPGEDRLSRFDLVILLNLGGATSAIDDSIYDRYEEYLSIGGRLWVIGLNNFQAAPVIITPDEKEVPSLRWSWVPEYFGVDRVINRPWDSSDSMTLEFVRAEPFGLWKDLPTLVPDTIKCQKLVGYKWWVPLPGGPACRFGTRGIPFVCVNGLSNPVDYEYRYPAQRRIYTYRSYYGSSSVAGMDGNPCAENYIGPTYRTAEFTFPLNLMKNEEADGFPAFKVMEEMVRWFLP
jgi:hypothetical protein